MENKRNCEVFKGLHCLKIYQTNFCVKNLLSTKEFSLCRLLKQLSLLYE